jgi:hypothetical protein
MRVVHVLLRCMVAGLSLALPQGGEAQVRSLSGAVSGAVSSASAEYVGIETSELDEPDEGPAGEAVRSLGHSNDHRPDLA